MLRDNHRYRQKSGRLTMGLLFFFVASVVFFVWSLPQNNFSQMDSTNNSFPINDEPKVSRLLKVREESRKSRSVSVTDWDILFVAQKQNSLEINSKYTDSSFRQLEIYKVTNVMILIVTRQENKLSEHTI